MGEKVFLFKQIKNKNEIYFGTREGLYIYDPEGLKPLRKIMGDYSISSVEFDFEDNLWVSTLQAGLYFIPSLDVNIYNKQNNLPEDKITCLEHDNAGNLWIGMAEDNYGVLYPDGSFTLSRLDASSPHDIANIRHFENSTFVIGKSSIRKISGTTNKTYNIYANDLFQDKTHVYLGQDNTILLERSIFENHITEVIYNMVFKRSDYEFVNARTNVIKADKYNHLWVGTSKGIYYYGDTLINLGELNPLLKSPVRDIAFDNNGFYTYIATLNGLLIIKDNKLTKILDKESELSTGDYLMVVKNNYFWFKETDEAGFIANGEVNGCEQSFGCTGTGPAFVGTGVRVGQQYFCSFQIGNDGIVHLFFWRTGNGCSLFGGNYIGVQRHVAKHANELVVIQGS